LHIVPKRTADNPRPSIATLMREDTYHLHDFFALAAVVVSYTVLRPR
jgi:hypothetical protein